MVKRKTSYLFYLKDAGNCVNLNYHKFTYKDSEYTQYELIKKMQQLLDYITSDIVDDWSKEYDDAINEFMEIWTLIHRTM